MKSVTELGREKENAWNADTWFEDVSSKIVPLKITSSRDTILIFCYYFTKLFSQIFLRSINFIDIFQNILYKLTRNISKYSTRFTSF